jgi:two-component system CheB/CheR fusion protein
MSPPRKNLEICAEIMTNPISTNSEGVGLRSARQLTALKSAESGVFPIVAIGASAGGLEVFRGFLDAQSPKSGMAFVMIQHLDPTHPSLMVELLSSHTSMSVVQAADGAALAA